MDVFDNKSMTNLIKILEQRSFLKNVKDQINALLQFRRLP
jgi:hypothetical protein